jgi:hypothetical protein
MRTKKKQNSKVSKSAKTRLSDLIPKADARGGKYAPAAVAGAIQPAPTPPIYRKKPLTL